LVQAALYCAPRTAPQSEFLPGKHLERDALIEIVDPVTGVSSSEGEILVTHLHRRLQPLIRYRVGDRGRRINSPCACGLALPVIELEGRTEELEVKVGEVCVRADDVAEAIRDVPGIGERFQMRVRCVNKKDEFRIMFEGAGVSSESIRAALLLTVPALQTLDSSTSHSIHVVKRGEIPTTAAKTPRIVDKRLG